MEKLQQRLFLRVAKTTVVFKTTTVQTAPTPLPPPLPAAAVTSHFRPTLAASSGRVLGGGARQELGQRERGSGGVTGVGRGPSSSSELEDEVAACAGVAPAGDLKACVEWAVQLVQKSRGSWKTRQYDLFQQYSNGIHP
jgi:hypothetical protein